MTLATQNPMPEAMLKAISTGDIKDLSPAHRMEYYLRLCNHVGLDPIGSPFQLITLQGRLTLYLSAQGATQLAKRDCLSVKVTPVTLDDDGLLFCKATVTDPLGRETEASAYVDAEGKRGQSLADFKMKCETKARRRGILAYCGITGDSPEDVEGARIVEMPAVTQGAESSAVCDATAELKAELDDMGWGMGDLLAFLEVKEWKDYAQPFGGQTAALKDAVKRLRVMRETQAARAAAEAAAEAEAAETSGDAETGLPEVADTHAGDGLGPNDTVNPETGEITYGKDAEGDGEGPFTHL